MKNIKLFLIFLISLGLYNCSEDNSNSTNTISPSNPDALASVLVFPNAEEIISITLPSSSDPSVAPVISHMDVSISYSSGSQIFIPCNVVSPTQANIAGVYIQVKGGTTYFDVPINAGTANGLISLPIGLPSIVGPGNFILILKFYDVEGNVSATVEVNITVTTPSNCGVTKVSGGEGLTSNVFVIPKGQNGVIKISYETYTVPDKIDVYQNGVWIGGTGPFTERATLRKALNCNIATEIDGYKGEQGEFSFNYVPAAGNEIEVVVSGCEDGGTAWEYTFSCPQQSVIGEGTVIINGISYGVKCIAAQTSDFCPGEETSVHLNSFEGESMKILLTISNMPPEEFGEFDVYSGTEIDHCALQVSGLFGVGLNTTSIWSFGGSGKVTKTGSNSFTFTKTWSDPFSDEVYTISGSGTYQLP